MDCDENIVRLTYKQLKEMAEASSREETVDGVYISQYYCNYRQQYIPRISCQLTVSRSSSCN